MDVEYENTEKTFCITEIRITYNTEIKHINSEKWKKYMYTEIRSFITLTPGANVIKLRISVLRRFSLYFGKNGKQILISP